jgi:Protein of unknown function (DUF3606).
MADDLHKRRPQDASKISLTERWEIEYWTQVLGVSEAKLREAIRKVGNGAAAVREYLRQNR